MWALNLVGTTIIRRSSGYTMHWLRKSLKTKERETSSTKPWMVIGTQPIRNSNLAHILIGTFWMLREILLQTFKAMHPFLFTPHCSILNQSGRKNGGKATNFLLEQYSLETRRRTLDQMMNSQILCTILKANGLLKRTQVKIKRCLVYSTIKDWQDGAGPSGTSNDLMDLTDWRIVGKLQ